MRVVARRTSGCARTADAAASFAWRWAGLQYLLQVGIERAESPQAWLRENTVFTRMFTVYARLALRWERASTARSPLAPGRAHPVGTHESTPQELCQRPHVPQGGAPGPGPGRPRGRPAQPRDRPGQGPARTQLHGP